MKNLLKHLAKLYNTILQPCHSTFYLCNKSQKQQIVNSLTHVVNCKTVKAIPKRFLHICSTHDNLYNLYPLQSKHTLHENKVHTIKKLYCIVKMYFEHSNKSQFAIQYM